MHANHHAEKRKCERQCGNASLPSHYLDLGPGTLIVPSSGGGVLCFKSANTSMVSHSSSAMVDGVSPIFLACISRSKISEKSIWHAS